MKQVKFELPDWFFFALLIALSLAFYKIISYFIIDFFLAIILAHLFYGPYKTFRNKCKFNNRFAAISSMLLALVTIIIPLITVGILLSNEATTIYFTIREKWPRILEILQNEGISGFETRFKFLGQYFEMLEKIDIYAQLTRIFSTGAEMILTLVQQTFLNVSFIFFHLVIILILMVFLLLDGKKLMNKIQYLSPLKDKDEEELFNEIIKITDATLIGTIIIGIIEGTYGGIIFATFGIPSALFWGVVMALFSMIPIIGINTVLITTGIVLILLGKIVEGFSIIALSIGGTTFTQNYLKPRLVGARGGLHPAIVLLSTLGGLAWFGILGFLIGPVIASLFISIWNQFGRRYQNELTAWNKG